MYFVEYNKLLNNKRIKVDKKQIKILNNLPFDKKTFANIHYKHYRILECNFYMNNKCFKYFVECLNSNDLDNLRYKLEKN